jgi:hypothetical protein
MLRRLKITASFGCALACFAVLALWVRSYFWHDMAVVSPTITTAININSMQGKMSFQHVSWAPSANPSILELYVRRLGPGENSWKYGWFVLGFGISDYGSSDLTHFTYYAPHWAVFLPLAFASVEFWWPRHYRFGLRTMLIATTAVAIILGLIVAFSR